MELTEKLERSIVALLVAQNDGGAPSKSIWPDSMMGAGNTPRIFPGETDTSKDGQSIIVIVHDSNGEEPQFSGNHFHDVEILVRTPATLQTDAEQQPDQDGNKADSNLVAHKAAAAALSDIMEQDAFILAAQIMAAVAPQDFTIFGGLLSREPLREQRDEYWSSGWRFRVLGANQAF